MFSYISEGEPKEYGFLPAGVYEGKIVKMEEGNLPKAPKRVAARS